MSNGRGWDWGVRVAAGRPRVQAGDVKGTGVGQGLRGQHVLPSHHSMCQVG